MKKRLVVVAGLLIKKDKILVGLRKKGNLWEFPGGKVEDGESPLKGLFREFDEEVGAKLQKAYLIHADCVRSPKGRDLVVLFYAITKWQKTPSCLHHKELRWVTQRELKKIPLLPANQKVISEILSEIKRQKFLRK